MHVYSKQIFFDINYRYCDCWNHRKPNSHRTQYSDRLAFSFKVCVPDNIRSLKTDLGLNFDYRKTATKDGKKKRFSVTSKIFRYFLSLIQIKNSRQIVYSFQMLKHTYHRWRYKLKHTDG